MFYDRFNKRYTVETPFMAKFSCQKSTSEPEFFKPGPIQSVPRIVLKLLKSITSINLSWKWILKISKFESTIQNLSSYCAHYLFFHI